MSILNQLIVRRQSSNFESFYGPIDALVLLRWLFGYAIVKMEENRITFIFTKRDWWLKAMLQIEFWMRQNA